MTLHAGRTGRFAALALLAAAVAVLHTALPRWGHRGPDRLLAH